VLGELYARNAQPQEAKNYFDHALKLTQSDAEKKLLKEKLKAIEVVLWN
jgi:predicted RNA polymerase sigma factor